MHTTNRSAGKEIGLRTAAMLTGKTIKTMQRWCDEGKIPFRIVDLRGKMMVPLGAVLPFTPITSEDGYLVEQAEGNNNEAQNEIGIIFLEARKPEIAFYWFQEAAKYRHADAMRWLSKYYIYGNMGVEKDESLGLNWLAAAAKQGNIIAKAQINALHDVAMRNAIAPN